MINLVKADYAGLMDRFSISEDGTIIGLRYGRKPKSSKRKDGYICVSTVVSGKQVFLFAHRLVALKFVPNPEGLPYVNHINGIKHDNRAENLEWCTPKQNIRHAVMSGLIPSGKNRVSTKLSESDVNAIRILHASGVKQIILAESFDVDASLISKIVANKHRTLTEQAISEYKAELA